MAVTIELIDRSGKFLPFYELAQGKTPDERWALWQEHYGMAMIPPGPDGQALGRRLLDACWDRYPEVMDRIKAGAAGITPSPQSAADKVAAVLVLDKDLLIRVVTFVANMEGSIAICTAMAAHPGLSEERYIEHEPGWLAQCRQHERAICQAVLENLQVEDVETFHRFIFGPGPGAGLGREAYYAGYRVIKHMLEKGQTLAQLARVPASNLEQVVGGALREIIGMSDTGGGCGK